MISQQSWVLPDHWWLLPLAVGVVAAFLGRRTKPIALARVERALSSVWAPVATGVLTAVLGAWVWGSLDPPPVYHDEVAYRLQAEIFASGRLTGDPAPLPEFFEQYHVLVSPRLAPKYLPGHALALVPGIWLGRSGLGPLALAGISGGLLFVLARCLAGPWVAALAWTLWATAPAPLSWRCTYFSEATSGAAWLAACWALLDWLDTSRRASLVAVATFLGWCAITRPLTAVALALPVAAVVIKRQAKRRALGELVWPILAGAAVVAIVLPFNAAATGSPLRLAYTAYNSRYMPWDHLGFGIDPVPPPGLPPDMVAFTEIMRPYYRAHTVERLPQALFERSRSWAREMWQAPGWNWRGPLCLLALFAIPVLGRGGAWAAASVLTLLVSYLLYSEGAHWTVYFQEAHTVLAYLTALGVAHFVTLAGGGRGVKEAAPFRPRPHDAAAMALLTTLALVRGAADANTVRSYVQARGLYQASAARLLSLIPEPRAVVFIRYAPRHSPHFTLVQNPPDYGTARVWRVYDRGPDNFRLLQLAPDRVPYLFNEKTWSVARLLDSSGHLGPPIVLPEQQAGS